MSQQVCSNPECPHLARVRELEVLLEAAGRLAAREVCERMAEAPVSCCGDAGCWLARRMVRAGQRKEGAD